MNDFLHAYESLGYIQQDNFVLVETLQLSLKIPTLFLPHNRIFSWAENFHQEKKATFPSLLSTLAEVM